MKIHLMLLALSCALVCASCSLSHGDPPGPSSDPDASLADANAPDAQLGDAQLTDAQRGDPQLGDPQLTDVLRECVPPLVEDGELCVGWRGVAAPPCEVLGLVRVDGRLGIECATATYVLRDDAWWLASELGEPIAPPTVSRPDTFFDDYDLIVAELPDGAGVATHGDVYAHPAAWRTGPDGAWRETLPPPSAFVRFGAALSDDEALFVGGDAYVFVRARR